MHSNASPAQLTALITFTGGATASTAAETGGMWMVAGYVILALAVAVSLALAARRIRRGRKMAGR